jgi:hypothetical protein
VQISKLASHVKHLSCSVETAIDSDAELSDNAGKKAKPRITDQSLGSTLTHKTSARTNEQHKDEPQSRRGKKRKSAGEAPNPEALNIADAQQQQQQQQHPETTKQKMTGTSLNEKNRTGVKKVTILAKKKQNLLPFVPDIVESHAFEGTSSWND